LHFDYALRLRSNSVKTPGLYGYAGVVVHRSASLASMYSFYAVLKAMGLAVNTDSDWNQLGDASSKKEQLLMPLKSIERQLLAVLKNPNKAEMESQLFPLLNTASKGDGTVLLQNRLGQFGLEKLLQTDAAVQTVKPAVAPDKAVSQATSTTSNGNDKPVQDKDKPITDAQSTVTALTIPGAGLIVDAHQLTQVLAGLMMNDISCARIIPEQSGKLAANTGIILFTTKDGSPRPKGGTMEFEFSAGKINRIAFQSPTYRDFEQDVQDNPDASGCRIDPALLTRVC